MIRDIDSSNMEENQTNQASAKNEAVEDVEKKLPTLKDVAKYSALVVLALPYLATFFPQYALFFKAVGAAISVLSE